MGDKCHQGPKLAALSRLAKKLLRQVLYPFGRQPLCIKRHIRCSKDSSASADCMTLEEPPCSCTAAAKCSAKTGMSVGEKTLVASAQLSTVCAHRKSSAHGPCSRLKQTKHITQKEKSRWSLSVSYRSF